MRMIKLYCFAWFLIIVVSITGDQLLKMPRFWNDLNYLIAITDTLIHGFLGYLSWIMFILIKIEQIGDQNVHWIRIIIEPHISMLFSIFIDLDHIIVAGSFKLKDILSIKHRPFMHNTYIMLIMVAIIWYLTHRRSSNMFAKPLLRRIPFIMLNAIIVHHIRDALRHGINLYPLPSTPPIGLGTYYAVIFIFPFILSRLTGYMGMDFDYKRKHLPQYSV